MFSGVRWSIQRACQGKEELRQNWGQEKEVLWERVGKGSDVKNRKKRKQGEKENNWRH